MKNYLLLTGSLSNSICLSKADLPFEMVAAVHRSLGSALPGKPGPSMSVSMLFVTDAIAVLLVSSFIAYLSNTSLLHWGLSLVKKRGYGSKPRLCFEFCL